MAEQYYQVIEGKLVTIYSPATTTEALRIIADATSEGKKPILSPERNEIKIDEGVKIPNELQPYFQAMQERIDYLERYGSHTYGAPKSGGTKSKTATDGPKPFTNTERHELASEQAKADYDAVAAVYDKARRGEAFTAADKKTILDFRAKKFDFVPVKGPAPKKLFPFLDDSAPAAKGAKTGEKAAGGDLLS